MCECGCTSNDKKYTLPGPDKSYYLVTLRGHCVECDGPSAVIIEHLEPGTHDHKYYRQKDYTNGRLPLKKWSDTKGVNIATGKTQAEFIAALRAQIVGIDSDELSDGPLDAEAADVILEEMYEDAQTFPEIVK